LQSINILEHLHAIELNMPHYRFIDLKLFSISDMGYLINNLWHDIACSLIRRRIAKREVLWPLLFINFSPNTAQSWCLTNLLINFSPNTALPWYVTHVFINFSPNTALAGSVNFNMSGITEPMSQLTYNCAGTEASLSACPTVTGNCQATEMARVTCTPLDNSAPTRKKFITLVYRP